MKTNQLIIGFFTALSLLCTNCSLNDDAIETNIITDVEGVVLTPGACNTENNGIAYDVEVTNIEGFDKILVPNLSEEFKTENLRIKFDMVASNEGITFCQTTLNPPTYVLTNVRLIEKRDEN